VLQPQRRRGLRSRLPEAARLRCPESKEGAPIPDRDPQAAPTAPRLWVRRAHLRAGADRSHHSWTSTLHHRRPRCLLIPACRAASTGLSGVLSASEISTPMVVPATSTVVFSRGRNLQGMSTVRGGSEPVDPVPASVPPEPESSFSPEPVSSASREPMLSLAPGGPVSERWPEDASATSSLWSGPGSGLLIGLVLDR